MKIKRKSPVFAGLFYCYWKRLSQYHILRIVIPIIGLVHVELCFVSLVVASLAAEFGMYVDMIIGKVDVADVAVI